MTALGETRHHCSSKPEAFSGRVTIVRPSLSQRRVLIPCCSVASALGHASRLPNSHAALTVPVEVAANGGRRVAGVDDGDGRWAMGDGRWAMGRGRWAMGGGRWAMDSRRWTVDDVRWAVGGGRTINGSVDGQWDVWWEVG